MACEEWHERLAARLYDEDDPATRDEVDEHLARCEACRGDFAELSRARAWLAAGAPEVPASRPVVVLGRLGGRTALARWGTAALAAAAVLVAGIAIGVAFERSGGTGRGDAGPDAARLDELLAAQRAELTREFDARIDAAIEQARADLATRSDVDRGIANLRRAIADGRREDVDYLLAEIAGVELRSGAALDETARTLRYYALASNPDVTEW